MDDSGRYFKLRMCLGNQNKLLLEEEKVKENPHFLRLRGFGSALVSKFTDGTMDFHIADSELMNATVVYPTKSIVICRGALNGILRIGKAIVESELFPDMMGNYVPPSRRESSLPLDIRRRALLNPSKDFVLDPTQSPWVIDEERANLFTIITELLFGFLVCHEIAHHFHRHGERGGREDYNNFDSDEMLGEQEPGSLDKQARECVADDCGFRVLLHNMDEILSRKNFFGDSYLYFLKNKFFIHAGGLLAKCYQIAFIYFYFMEIPNWEEMNPDEWAYPPAGFRLHAIYSSSLAQPPLDLERSSLFGLLEEALASADEIVRVAFGLPFDIDWLSKMGQYKPHAEKVSERMGRWSCEGERVWEPYLEE